MNREEKRSIRRKITNLLDTECKGCKRTTSMNSYIYCSTQCNVGNTLINLGEKLLGKEAVGEPTFVEVISVPVVHEALIEGAWEEHELFYLKNHLNIFQTNHLAMRLNRKPRSVGAKIAALRKKHPELNQVPTKFKRWAR